MLIKLLCSEHWEREPFATHRRSSASQLRGALSRKTKSSNWLLGAERIGPGSALACCPGIFASTLEMITCVSRAGQEEERRVVLEALSLAEAAPRTQAMGQF